MFKYFWGKYFLERGMLLLTYYLAIINKLIKKFICYEINKEYLIH